MRRFELIEGTSSKFWEVGLEDSSVTVRFGRIGTQGQTQTKTFSDALAAKKEHDKLVKDKTGKRYGEVGVAAGTALPAAPVPPPAAAPTPATAPDAPPAVQATALPPASE